jgi:hypothetical protein
MARDAGDLVRRRVEPNTVGSTLTVQGRNHGAADGVPIPRVSYFRDFENLAYGLRGKAFFCQLALALQRQL